MGHGRVSAREQGGVDQAGARVISLQVSTNQGGCLLARTLAKRRGLLQQPAGKLFGRIVASLSPRRSEPGLARRAHTSAGTNEVTRSVRVAHLSLLGPWSCCLKS